MNSKHGKGSHHSSSSSKKRETRAKSKSRKIIKSTKHSEASSSGKSRKAKPRTSSSKSSRKQTDRSGIKKKSKSSVPSSKSKKETRKKMSHGSQLDDDIRSKYLSLPCASGKSKETSRNKKKSLDSKQSHLKSLRKAEKSKMSKKAAIKPKVVPKKPAPAPIPSETDLEQEEAEAAESSAHSSDNFPEEAQAQASDSSLDEQNVDSDPEESDVLLESTKPTINQQKKPVKERPLSTAEKIEKSEFEKLYDEINELNSGVKTLKNSYGSIIKSLMAMQSRRIKKKMLAEKKQKQQQQNDYEESIAKYGAIDERFCMDNFVNQDTRDETFKQLFNEVEEVNKSTQVFRKTCFDQRGNFLREKYEQLSPDQRFDRKSFNQLRTLLKNLNTVISEIARSYNDDLLDMFRLV